jgi:hypothetical protein
VKQLLLLLLVMLARVRRGVEKEGVAGVREADKKDKAMGVKDTWECV